MEKRRSIPRHVDGRIKVGLVPISSFLKTLPIYAVILVLILAKPTPIGAFIGILVGAITYFLTCELNNKETGLDIVKEILRYEKEGDIVFERNGSYKDESKKIIHNKLDETIVKGLKELRENDFRE